MFAELLTGSDAVEVIRETVDEDSSSVKLELRATHKKRWSRLMLNLLVDTIDESDYGLAINKAYWADEESKKIRFCWVIIIWGDLKQALLDLTPVLSKKAVASTPPAEVSKMVTESQRGATILRRRRLRGGRGTATDIRLPHRSPRGGHGNRTKKSSDIGKRGTWGFAQSIGGEDGGDPWY